MTDEARSSDEIRIPVTIQLPWSGKFTAEGQPWPMDAQGRDWPSHRGQPEFPISQLPRGFAPGTTQASPGDGKSLAERFQAIDNAMRAEVARVRRMAGDPDADTQPGQAATPPTHPPMSAAARQQAFDSGLASSPNEGALTIPQDHDSHFAAKTLRDFSGAPMRAATGEVPQTPEAYSPEFFRRRGKEDAARYAKAVAVWTGLQQQAAGMSMDAETAAAASVASSLSMAAIEADLALTPLAKFGQGKTWDAQRAEGQTFNQFRDASTIYIGIYGAAAGIPEPMLQQIQNDYASMNSKFHDEVMSKEYPALPERNVENLRIGYAVGSNSKPP